MADTRSVLFLGRHVGYPIALEGALKLKELAYIHAEGFAAGELKHGPIALIDAGPAGLRHRAVARDAPHELHKKVVSNIQEIRARGARIIVDRRRRRRRRRAATPTRCIRIPRRRRCCAPLLAVVPLQIFALDLATAKGLDVDQPRNLAKSVTVE